MATTVRRDRLGQIVAWAVVTVFFLGFFLSPIGKLTGPIMGAWFVGTQRPRRGFLWAVAINLVTSLLFEWHKIPLTGPVPTVEYLGWLLLATVLGALPVSYTHLDVYKRQFLDRPNPHVVYFLRIAMHL